MCTASARDLQSRYTNLFCMILIEATCWNLQLLLATGDVKGAMEEIDNFCKNPHLLPLSIKALLLESLNSKHTRQISQCYEAILQINPSSANTLQALINLHITGIPSTTRELQIFYALSFEIYMKYLLVLFTGCHFPGCFFLCDRQVQSRTASRLHIQPFGPRTRIIGSVAATSNMSPFSGTTIRQGAKKKFKAKKGGCQRGWSEDKSYASFFYL
jgi:hypothetical protein